MKRKELIFECLVCGMFFNERLALLCATPNERNKKEQEVVTCPKCRERRMRVLITL